MGVRYMMKLRQEDEELYRQVMRKAKDDLSNEKDGG